MHGASTGGFFSVPSLGASKGSSVVWREGVCIDYQHRIRGTSRLNVTQRSIAAGYSGKPVAADQSSIWWL